jgi:hypothetical protein
MKLKLIILFSIPIFFSACTSTIMLGNCIDSALPTLNVKDDKVFEITIENKLTNNKISQTLICENYYSSSCSARGNYWSWKLKNKIKTVSSSTVNGPNILITLPNCRDLIKKREKFSFKSESDNKHMYKIIKNDKYFLHHYNKDKSKIKYYELPVVITIVRD